MFRVSVLGFGVSGLGFEVLDIGIQISSSIRSAVGAQNLTVQVKRRIERAERDAICGFGFQVSGFCGVELGFRFQDSGRKTSRSE